MSYSTSSFGAIAGVVLRTTPQYHRHMTFAKIIELVAEASRKGVSDDEGNYTYQYTAPSRHTNPYRVLTVKIHNAPARWLEVTDWPNGGHVGLEERRYANPNIAEDDEPLQHDRKRDMWFSVAPPKGWQRK